MSEGMKTEEYASYACPWCKIETPHQHFIDRKGYVRGFINPDDVLGRIPLGDRLEDDVTWLRAECERLRTENAALEGKLDKWYTVEARISGALSKRFGVDAISKAIVELVGEDAKGHNPLLDELSALREQAKVADTLTCDRCGVEVPAEWAFHEEAGATECPRCWHRCEEKELRDEIARLRESAKLAECAAQAGDELLTIVMGECRSLIDEDSGGSFEGFNITEAIRRWRDQRGRVGK